MQSIRRFRQARGLSIRRLAKRARLHWTTIWKIEKTGRVPSLRTLQKLARAFRLSVTDLLSNPPN
jgi:transcriptional regulator with XRE-family HTH domain